MPSPLLHVTAGYVLYRVFRRRDEPQPTQSWVSSPRLLAATVGFSVLPDIDAVVGLLMNDFGRYHNNLTHSLAAALLVGLAAGLIARAGFKTSFRRWFILAIVPYALHVTMDFFTTGRGVMLAWPLTDARYFPPFVLFYGLRWSEGLVSVHHLRTLITEVPVAMANLLIVHVWNKRKLAPPASDRLPSSTPPLLARKGTR
jgi:membrane-bound metal-dependent hydrolase YbcI (DUF457 family)